MVNDGIAEFVSRRPDRFAALDTVPMQNDEAAVKELERCISKLGFKGVEILTNVAGVELSDPAYDSFWAKAEAFGAVVLIHPNSFTDAQRLSRFYFNNVIGNPLDTAIALHYLIFDGVLERHPNLKIIAVHGGGYVAAYSGRIDHAWARARIVVAACHNRQPPISSESTSIQWFTRRISLTHCFAFFGVDHVLMGTDYPNDMADFDPIGHLASLGTLHASDPAAIAGATQRSCSTFRWLGTALRRRKQGKLRVALQSKHAREKDKIAYPLSYFSHSVTLCNKAG